MVASMITAAPVLAELSAEPYAAVGFSLNDNKRLRSRDGSGVLANKTTLGSRLNYARPRWSARIAPEFSLLRHTNHRELDNEDYRVDAQLARDFVRHRLELGMDFARSLSAAVELTEAGQIDAAIPRTTIAVDGAWTWEIGERISSTAFGSIADTGFDAEPGSALVDYEFASAGLSLRYGYSARTRWLVTLAVQDFSLPDLDTTTTSYTYRFGLESAVSDTIGARLTIGQSIDVNRFETDQLVVDPIDPSRFVIQRSGNTVRDGRELINASVEKRFARGVWSVGWDRQFNPSSLGARLRIESVNTQMQWRFDHRIRLSGYLSYRDQTRESATDNDLQPQERLQATLGLQFRLDRNWTLSPRYRYTRRWSPLGAPSADANEIALELRFSGDRFTRFR